MLVFIRATNITLRDTVHALLDTALAPCVAAGLARGDARLRVDRRSRPIVVHRITLRIGFGEFAGFLCHYGQLSPELI